MLLSEAIERLVIATQADGLSPNTTDGYRRKLKPLLDFLGDVPVEEITTDDLRRYVAYIRGRRVTLLTHYALSLSPSPQRAKRDSFAGHNKRAREGLQASLQLSGGRRGH